MKVVDVKTKPATLAEHPNGAPDLCGLYVHVPFCVRKCPYCSFFSITDLSLKKKYIDAFAKEMTFYAGRRLFFDTVYFGGGTPCLLSPSEISFLLGRIRESFRISEDSEITLEANPGAVPAGGWRGYRQAGVNRVNLGAQSFREKNLRFLGRIHSAEAAARAVGSARDAGIENIGLDLIYGLPSQTMAEWQEDLRKALSLVPEHLSCYMLSYEKGTPMQRAAQRAEIVPLDESRSAGLFAFTLEFLAENGYPPYEISNFARTDSRHPGRFQSRHNRKYWDLSPYLGLGPSAHSYLPPARFSNVVSVEGYIRAVDGGRPPVRMSEIPNREQRMMERVMLGLRTAQGVDLARFAGDFGVSFCEVFARPLARMIREDFLVLSEKRCAPTFKGMRFHDGICELLVREI